MKVKCGKCGHIYYNLCRETTAGSTHITCQSKCPKCGAVSTYHGEPPHTSKKSIYDWGRTYA